MDKIIVRVNGRKAEALVRKMWCDRCNGFLAHLVLNCGMTREPPCVKIQTICTGCGFDKDGITAAKIKSSQLSIPDFNALVGDHYL